MILLLGIAVPGFLVDNARGSLSPGLLFGSQKFLFSMRPLAPSTSVESELSRLPWTE